MTSGQLSAHGRHGGHEPFTLSRAEPADPAPAVDASLGHELGGRCRADAGERPHYGRYPHPARRLPVLGQGLGEAEPALLQLIPDLLALAVHLDGLQTRSLALIA